MKIILLEKVPNYGEKNDVIDAPAGYVINFLIPRKKAVIATAFNLHKRTSLLAKQDEQYKKMLGRAYAEKKVLEQEVFVFIVNAFQDKITHYITTKKIINVVFQKTNIKLSKKNFHNFTAIKKIGKTIVKIKIYQNVVASIGIEVIPQKNEAD